MNLFPFNWFPQRVGSSRARYRVRCGSFPYSFPFNWFPQRVGSLNDFLDARPDWDSFHSIGFPSEWGADSGTDRNVGRGCFHSIGFPSEWGVEGALSVVASMITVSIQLVSPASGERILVGDWSAVIEVSIQLVSPASGESWLYSSAHARSAVSIQLVSPASGE